MPARELVAQRPRLESGAGPRDLGDAHVFGKEVRRHQHEPAHAVILDAAGIDRGDRGAVAVADEKPAAEAYRVEHAGKHVQRLLVHERERPRQTCRRGVAVTGARVGKNPGAGCCRELLREAAPPGDAAEALVQQNQRRRRIRTRTDHAVFEPHPAKREEPLIGERHCPAPAVQFAAMRASFAKLCSTVSPEVSSSACARA